MLTISVALFRRDPISRDPSKRKIYQHESYHWGILIIEGNEYDAYDATDKNEIDPVTFRQTNPTAEWLIQTKLGANPYKSGKFLGHIVIGTIPPEAGKSRGDIKVFLEAVPTPQRNQNPQESCVTWIERVIRAFEEEKWVSLDIGRFKDWALSYADRRLAVPAETPQLVDYRDVVGW